MSKSVLNSIGSFLLFLCLGLGVSGQDSNQKNGLLGFYPFNGSAKDISGLQKKGKIVNANPAKDRKGIARGAWQFNANKISYISLPVDISTDTCPIVTIVAWIKSSQSYSSLPVISGGDYKQDRALFTMTKDYVAHWTVQCGKDGELIGPPVLADQWTFFAIMYDQKNQEVRFIVNDQLFTGRAKTRPGSKNVIIGHFDGTIDEIKFFNRFLTLAELEGLYGKKINATQDQLKVIERYGYLDKKRMKREESVKLNEKYTIDSPEFIVTDAANSGKYKAVLTKGDTVIINAIEKETGWIQLKYKDNQLGWTHVNYLEKYAYGEGSSHILHWLKMTFKRIFDFTSLKSWIIIILFAIILFFSHVKFAQMDDGWRRLRRRIVGSRYGATTLEKTFLGRIFPPDNVKSWSLIIGATIGTTLFIGLFWDAEEFAWFLNEGFNLLPIGYDRTIHWFLYIVSMLILLATLGMIIESFVVAGWGVGWLRILILFILNFMSLMVTYYIFLLIMLILFVRIGWWIFNVATPSLSYTCPHCGRPFSANFSSKGYCPHCHGSVST